MSIRNVAIIAPAALSDDRLFDPSVARDNVLERFAALRARFESQGIACRTDDLFDLADIDVLIFHDIMNELERILSVVRANPEVRLVYLPNEPSFVVPLHDENILPGLPVDLVLTWNDRIAGRFDRVHKLNIGQPLISPDHIPSVPFAEKKFICSIFAFKPPKVSGTLFEERLRAVAFFDRQDSGIDLYGIGWEIADLPFVDSAYRGPVDNKREIQQQYRFSIAFENTSAFPGLITEKIFDCLAAGSVPIYLGAPNVSDYIPPDCFIDVRDFATLEVLHTFLTEMSEARYESYLAAAQRFLRSPQYHPFTAAGFAETVTRETGALAKPQPPRSTLGIKRKLFLLLLLNPRLWRHWRRCKRFMLTLATKW